MSKWIFISLVAVAFGTQMAWSAYQAWPVESHVTLARIDHDAPHIQDPLLAWDRHDAMLDAIMTSAVWKASCLPQDGLGCTRQDANL